MQKSEIIQNIMIVHLMAASAALDLNLDIVHSGIPRGVLRVLKHTLSEKSSLELANHPGN